MKKLLCIIPFYNRETLLEEAIESVLQQTYSNIELVLVNDGSTDNSLKVAEPYTSLPNVHLITYPTNRGVSYARNQGLSLLESLQCDYYTVHDSDDVSDLERFEKVLELFEDDTLAVKTSYVRTDLEHNFIFKDGQPDTHASEGIAFFSKKVLDHIGYYSDLIAAEDTDYWYRLEHFIKFHPQYSLKSLKTDFNILYLARVSGDNLTVKYEKEYPLIIGEINKNINKMCLTQNFYKEKFI